MMTHQGSDFLELGAEIGVGALAHGLGDFLHLLGALVGFTNLTDQHEGVQKASDRDHEHDEERDSLYGGEGRRGIEEGKGLEGGLSRRLGHRGLRAQEGDEDRQAEENDEGHREAAAACPLAAHTARSDHIEPRFGIDCFVSAKKRKLG